jgi:hypothetical protein
MEAKIKIVSETAGITMEDAKMALELADGVVERALELVPYVEKSIVVVHGRFVCGKQTKLYGIFRMLGQGRDGQLLDFGLAMSYTQSDIETPITASPEAYKKIVDSLFKANETNQIRSFMSGFYDKLGVAQVYQVYALAKEGMMKEVNDLFQEMVGKIWGGSERIEVETKVYLMTKVQCEKTGLLDRMEDSKDDEGTDGSNLTIYLETEPMISPVKGRTIDKFMPNELIPVKITDQRDAGRYLGRILANQFGIAFGQMKDVYYNEVSNRYQVTVEFGPKINGRFVIEPSVRLAGYADVANDAPVEQNAPTMASGEVGIEDEGAEESSTVALLLIGGVIVAFILYVLR